VSPDPAATPRRRSLGSVLRTKPVAAILADAEEPEHKLRRALGPVQLTLFGIGAIVGAGIFATIGTAAAGDAYRPGAGPALSLSFVITAIVCGFTALCYAELASTVPISGSAYTYAYATLGELTAWIIGWDLIIEYAVGNVGVAISWANYFKTLLKGIHIPALGVAGIHVPDWLSMDYRTAARLPGVYDSAPHLFGVPIVVNVLAVAIVAAVTLVLVWGVRESARFNAVMVAIKLVVLAFFVVVGCFYIEPANYQPFAPNGWAGISAGAAIVFFAYIGFDAVSTVAEETRDPQRSMPIGIIASLVVCTILYVVVAVVFSGLVSYPDLKAKLATEQAEPLTMALQHAMPDSRLAVLIVALGAVIANTAVLLVFQLGQPRIFFSMARDGMLPPVFYRVHPRFRTPHVSTILTGVFVGVCAAVASIDEMVDLTNIGTLFAFVLVCAGTIVLRVTDPDRPRPFRVPSGWGWTALLYAGFTLGVVLLPAGTLGGTAKVALLAAAAILFALSRRHIFPVLGIVSSLYLIYYLPPSSWLRFAAWLNFGFVIYVAYGAVHSRLTGRHTALPQEHDRHTARVGAALAVVGVILLVTTRALDVWLAAAKQAPGAGGAAALPAVFQPGPWLEVSWFLIVPLAVNAFVLCPVVIRRALRGDRMAAAPRALASLFVAASVMAATMAYLWVLAAA
jgi:APA family basic amino acid/polyamine antiporter